ncbi:hypothetical protein VN12_04485 [Pirellula sp. SH-Sr6A]|uniref:DUF7133 domain-containing protein n=1 Tax=Pirellula sp. SH-Sr6A TaxID=1632865 RepID=UPI00078C7C15|nr:HEAT repeat domain-containing protein [Pirellula sp. SH-Sr6A]AMV31351.1 hypothetical protein VN12_04485 [Pirellula sp. SH-Sr6A]
MFRESRPNCIGTSRTIPTAALLIAVFSSVSPVLGQFQIPGLKRPTSAPAASSPAGQVNVPPSPNGKTEREPIWAANSNGRGEAYFRKELDLPTIERAHIEFEASQTCEIYLNGLRIGSAKTPGQREKVDVTATARPGKNIIAIRASHRVPSQPSLSFAFFFKPVNQKWRIVVSDSQWKATGSASQGWQQLRYDDSKWPLALSRYEETDSEIAANSMVDSVSADSNSISKAAPQPFAPADDAKTATSKSPPIKASLADYDSSKGPPPPERFTTKPGFVVKEVFGNKEVGSIVAMTFNEFGHIIASQEGGPLLLLYDSNKDGSYDKTRVYCELVKNIQGVLALNGDVYVTGDGSEGSGLYRLIDSDRNGELEKAELLTAFKGVAGEHGPHQMTFGPDGSIYLVVGNHSQLDAPWPEESTYTKPYEGDLVQPRFEDPGGHAEGVKAPGGTVLRYDLLAKKTTIVAGGLRNAYDLAFHPYGGLYVHDSDMEADIGAVWHRDTSLFRVVEGGEYGWRSGWANWPEYYLDRLPSLASSGRGSPTGMAFYNHFKYPSRFHRALFLADWSEGRILLYNVEQDSSKAKMEEFVSGTPMNVTDLEVGPDGWLYFCTGGRGTDGGIYCVQWNGEVPRQVTDLGEGITKAVRIPQLHSAFGRQAAALTKKEIGDEWGELVAGVAYSSDNPARYRIQALDLMQMLGPVPTPEMLIELSNSTSEPFRARCVQLLGLHSDSTVAERLVELLADPSTMVRQAACESILRIGVICDPAALMKMLQSENRDERFLARRVLALVPSSDWKDEFLASASNRLVINAALVLISTQPSKENADAVFDALSRASEGFVSDADFVDLLRVMQVALHRSKLDKSSLTKWAGFVEREFPAGNGTINAELIRLGTYLQCDLVAPAIKYLQTDTSMPERVLIAMHLPMMKHEWTSKERMALLQFLESAQKIDGGGSYQLYVMRTSHSLSEFLTEEESLRILSLGEQYPNAALAALLKLPSELDAATIDQLVKLDSQIDRGGLEEDVFKRLKTGITAILSGQTSEVAQEHLRDRWRKSPDRRATIALAMAQKPDEKNWDYLVRSIGILDLFAIPDVCAALVKIDVATDESDAIRQAILQGCRLAEAGQSTKPIVDLLQYWTGEQIIASADKPADAMSNWQRWYEVHYPDKPPAALPGETERPRWSMEFLEQFLSGDQGKAGAIDNGALVFNKAQCSSCHKMNGKGKGFGPDLSSISKRFTKSEFLESTLYPSHVISDQYATKKVLTTSGEVHVGILVKTPNGYLVRVNQDKEVSVNESEVEEILPSKVSVMPSGLLDNLTPSEIRDLLCFLGYVPTIQVAEEKPAALRR